MINATASIEIHALDCLEKLIVMMIAYSELMLFVQLNCILKLQKDNIKHATKQAEMVWPC